MLIRGLVITSGDLASLCDKHAHLLRKEDGWDCSVYPRNSGERLVRCIGCIKGSIRPGSDIDSRMLKPVSSCYPPRLFLIQYLIGNEVPVCVALFAAEQRYTARLTTSSAKAANSLAVGRPLGLYTPAYKALSHGIQQIVGVPVTMWPLKFRTMFDSGHLTYSQRFMITMFYLHHGVDARNIIAWMQLNGSLRDQSAFAHVQGLIASYLRADISWGKHYKTYCVMDRKEKSIWERCTSHSHLL